MDDVVQALTRQDAWQRARSQLSWAEKLRQAVAMRKSLRGFAKTAPAAPDIGTAGKAAGRRLGKPSG